MKTLAVQKTNHASSQQVQSNSDYFIEKFPTLTTPDSIVEDRRILNVVLSGYGLAADINNKFFLKKILTEGVASNDTLANRLADHRYRELAKDFDYSRSPPPHLMNENLAKSVVTAYENHLFEVAVGDSDVNLRLALGFTREMKKIADSGASNTTMWYRILGSPPLRKILEPALSLPSDIGKLDIEVQFERMTQKAREKFGTSDIRELSAEPRSEAIVRKFILQSQLSSSLASSKFSTALALISSASETFQYRQ